MPDLTRSEDRPEAESPAKHPSGEPAVSVGDPSTRDPPSFPPQRWDGKDVVSHDVGEVWDAGADDEKESLHLQDWEGEEGPRPSPEQILEALQCVFRQMGPSVDGAATALNAVLQGPYFDDDSLMQLTGGGPMDAYAINMALRSFNLSLQPGNLQRGTTEPHLENAFMIFQVNGWFALRRVGTHWLNLSEQVLRPTQILPWHLSLSLGQLQDDGCEVYVVRGKLPACGADEMKFFDEHFLWFLNGGVMAEDVESDGCDGMCSGECTCYDVAEEAYEDELQAAIEASLADAQPGKTLAIKGSAPTGSPPTSLISSEEQVSSALSLKGVTSSQERDGDES